MASADVWQRAIFCVVTCEALTVCSYIPAWRHDWRAWRTLNFYDEAPLLYPPVFMNGAVWFSIQMVNAFALFSLLQLDAATNAAWQCAMWLWIASITVWTLWAVPFEMEQAAMWTWVDWLLTMLLSFGATVATLTIPGAHTAALLLLLYTGMIAVIVLANGATLFYRLCTRPPNLHLHRRWANPLAIWLANGTWQPYYGSINNAK